MRALAIIQALEAMLVQIQVGNSVDVLGETYNFATNVGLQSKQGNNLFKTVGQESEYPAHSVVVTSETPVEGLDGINDKPTLLMPVHVQAAMLAGDDHNLTAHTLREDLKNAMELSLPRNPFFYVTNFAPGVPGLPFFVADYPDPGRQYLAVQLNYSVSYVERFPWSEP